jgi:nicotinamidase/pyrazinamidase
LTGLHNYLIAMGVTELDVCGLATEYCVRFTAEDAVDLLPGVKVRFIVDASRGITPAGVEGALNSMAAKGIEIVTSEEIIAA